MRDTLHMWYYHELPTKIKDAFESAIEKRRSKFGLYSYVNRQSGKYGYSDHYVVECNPGHRLPSRWRLGRVVDQKLGAFLTCAKFVDPDIIDFYSASLLLENLINNEEFAQAWLEKVAHKIPLIVPTRGIKRKRSVEAAVEKTTVEEIDIVYWNLLKKEQRLRSEEIDIVYWNLLKKEQRLQSELDNVKKDLFDIQCLKWRFEKEVEKAKKRLQGYVQTVV